MWFSSDIHRTLIQHKALGRELGPDSEQPLKLGFQVVQEGIT